MTVHLARRRKEDCQVGVALPAEEARRWRRERARLRETRWPRRRSPLSPCTPAFASPLHLPLSFALCCLHSSSHSPISLSTSSVHPLTSSPRHSIIVGGELFHLGRGNNVAIPGDSNSRFHPWFTASYLHTRLFRFSGTRFIYSLQSWAFRLPARMAFRILSFPLRSVASSE
jgi:hypothetical protein